MRWFHITVAAIFAALCGLAVWGCMGLTRHVIVAVDRLGDAGAGLAQTTAKLNGKHGTIAMADEDLGALKSTIVHADLVARHEQQQLKTWDARGAVLFANLNGGITDLRETINAATGTANALTGTITEAKGTIAAARPVLEAGTRTLDETTATVHEIRTMTPDIARAAKGAADTTQETAGTMGDVHKVADHFEKEIDDPSSRPWYIKILPSVIQDAIEALITKWAVK